MQSEISYIYFSEFGIPVTYTPTGNCSEPMTILAVIDVDETKKVITETDRQRYHKVAQLTVRQIDGPFSIGDTFTFSPSPLANEPAIDWKLSGSSNTYLADGTQVLQVMSKQPFEIGKFRRDA
jgi:hypothetical protein